MTTRAITLPGLDEAARAALEHGEPILWTNPYYESADDGRAWPHDPAAARDRFARCAPLMAELFPELAATHGALHSPLTPIPRLQAALDPAGNSPAWLLKRDDALPVAGSVKARGGFHEVLALVEQIATDAGLTAAARHARPRRCCRRQSAARRTRRCCAPRAAAGCRASPAHPPRCWRESSTCPAARC